MKFLVPRLKPKYGVRDWLALFNIFKRKPILSYEHMFAKKFACRYGVMFSHGRVGLYALMKIWRLENIEVICPAYTCVVVPNAVVLSGNIPVFVDSQENGFNMSIQGIERAITEKTRVIIATHLFGYPMDVEAIQDIANRATEKYGHKVYVIQDCAHSYGAKWNNELVTSYGDAAIFGSNVSKIINSIFGGVVTTNDVTTYTELLNWRKTNCKSKWLMKSLSRTFYFVAVNVAFVPMIYTLVNWLERKGYLDRFVKYYEDGVVDFPVDWDQAPVSVESRIGLAQLNAYDQILNDRIRRARAIISHFKGNSKIRFMPDVHGSTYSHLVGIVDKRSAWVDEYRKQSIQLGVLIEYSIPNMAAFKKYKTVATPVSDYLSMHCVNFPLHTDLELKTLNLTDID